MARGEAGEHPPRGPGLWGSAALPLCGSVGLAVEVPWGQPARVLGGDGPRRAEAGGGQVELPAACTQGPALGGSLEARYPHTRPRGMVGSPGITPGPQESDSIGRPAGADCWPEGWGWGWVRGEGSAGSWCWMGHQYPCTSRATASCRGQMDRRSSVGWKPDCDVTPGSRVCAARRLPGARRPRPGPALPPVAPRGRPPGRPGRVTHNPALTQLSLPKEFNTMAFLLYLH